MRDLIAEQTELEEAADAEASAQAIREHAEIIAKGDIDKLPRGNALIARMFATVHEHIKAEQAVVARGVGAKIRGWLRQVPADVAAVIALRTTLAQCLQATGEHRHARAATLQRLAIAIGREWVREVQVRQAASVNPEYYQEAMRRLEQANVSSQAHVRKTLARVVKNVLDGVYDCDLSDTDLLHLGKHGLQGCMDAGLIELRRETGKGGHIVYYVLTGPVQGFLEDSTDMQRLASPGDTIMMVPPIPWQATTGGGYLTERRQLKYPMLRTYKRVRPSLRKEYREACSQEAMPQVYRYANYLQSIPYRMEPTVSALVQRLWAAGGGVLGMPLRTPPVKPEFPFGEGWEKSRATERELDEFGLWKRRTHNWHEERLKHRAAVWEMASFVKNTGRYSTTDCYFPVFLDGRGRLYYRGAPNPQGSDAAKAVIQFARKRPLGARGVFWLQVHIANCFGFDKVSFKERAAWTQGHWEDLRRDLSEPEHSALYRDADSPFCAVAACLELSRAFASGDPATYCTGLPVHMDATCSGLQHFSAMLRDAVGGEYVNLTPGGTVKADIYRRVAELAMLQVQRDAAGGNPLAVEWAKVGVSRAMAKGPCMTYVYGATLRSVSEGLIDHLAEAGWQHELLTYGKMTQYMAKLLFQAIADTVPAAAQAMRWLKDLIGKLERNQPATWCTPIGMYVNHDYQDEEMARVDIRSCGQSKVVMYRKLDTTKTLRMKNAIAPNFVHSLDAAHLGFTALRMQAQGLDMVCIHDSFGTHPSDVDEMHRCIRDAFVSMYSAKDHLADLAQQLVQEVEPVPLGTLDLQGIKDSEFFFC